MGWGEIGRPDEAPSPSKRHRRRKEVNSPRSVLFKSLYRAEKEKRERERENEREACFRESKSEGRRAAKLSVKSSRARKKCQRFSNLSVTI